MNLDKQLHDSVRSFDEMVDSLLPLLSVEAVKNHSIRYKVAYKLLDQLLNLAKSVIRMTKIHAEVKLQAVDENCQSIMALLRVLTEFSNKFYYLAIEPETDQELQLRWIYYSLVACVKYKTLLESIPAPDPDPERDAIFRRIDKSIKKHQGELQKLKFKQWPPFVALGKNKERGPARQQEVLAGMTQEDYLKSDFNRAISLRLNAMEKKHYQRLGNVAVHSSGFMLFFRDSKPTEGVGLVTGAACLNLFHASRHLALCALEMIHRYPDMEVMIDAKTKNDWQTLARDVKATSYLYS